MALPSREMGELLPKVVRIFISSPSDVAEERQSAAELVEQELAKRAAFRDRLKLDAFRYNDPHSDTPFFANRSAQGSVNVRLRSEDAEIVVAILWARMGTPVRDPCESTKILYQSGTEQEIVKALEAGREVLVYFRQGQPPAPDDDDALDEFKHQRAKVRAFRAWLEKCGRGINEYQDVPDFKRKLENHLDQFLTRIRDESLVLPHQATVVTQAPWPGDPYPGLRSFEPEEAPIFFGRNEETAELLRWVDEEHRQFIAVIGVSGTGKSSLVKAGLMPALPEWTSLTVRLSDAGGDPFRALAVQLELLLPPSRRAALRADQFKTLAEFGWIDELLKQKPASTCLLIVIDQFEELQTAVQENCRTRFVGLLKHLTDHDRIRIVISLRADFLGVLSRDETMSRLLSGNCFVLHPPSAVALRAIIREPARLVGATVDDSLIDELVEAARLEPGALPLLAFALEHLYSNREGRRLALPARTGSTTLGTILKDYTRDVEDTLTAEQVAALPQLFRHICRIEDGGRRIAKRRCRPSEIGNDTTLTALRDRLIEARLLLALDDPTEGVELAHEVLLEAWPQLNDWVTAYGTHLVVRDDVERLRASGAPRLEGWLLDRALDLLDEVPELLDQAQTTFVRHSREEYEDFLRREANAVAERAAAAAAECDYATAIALCLEVLPLTPRSRRPLSSLALSILYEGLMSMRAIDPRQGEVRAAAFDRDEAPTVSAEVDGTVWILCGHEGWVRTAAFNRDGTRVVSAGDDGTVRIWRADGTGDPLILRGHERGVQAAAFDRDGTRVVSAGDDGTVRIWQGDGSREPLILRGHEEPVRTAAFNRDGTRVVSASDDGTVRIWQADGSGEPLVLRGHDGWVRTAAFDRDGTRVVSAGDDGTVRIWQADGSGEPLILRGHEGSVQAVAFDRDGTRVVSAGSDATVRIWQADGSGEPLILRGHKRGVQAAAFDRDGTRVVSSSLDGTAWIWHADGSGEPLILRGHKRGVRAAAFDRDGTRVVSAGLDGTVRIWPLFESPYALIEMARARLPRGLTEAQRAKYHLPPRVITENSKNI